MFGHRATALAAGLAAAGILLGTAISRPAPVAAIGPGVAIVSTAIHDGHDNVVTSVPVGTYVHPYFAVSGTSGPASGDLTFFWWVNGTCSGTWAANTADGLTNGVLDATYAAKTTMEPTTWSYRGEYKGSASYGPAVGQCVAVTFTKATPTIVLQLHNSAHDPVTSVMWGTYLHASVSISGLADIPTGNVTIKGFADPACQTSATLAGPYLLAGGKADTAYLWEMDLAGSFSFRADYAGDSTYKAGTSPCITVTVSKYTPTLTFEFHDPSHQAVTVVPIGTVVHGSASLSGDAGTPTGQYDWEVFADANCGGNVIFEKTMAAGGATDPMNLLFNYGVPTRLTSRLVYTGNERYSQVTGDCMTVTWKATPTVDLAVHDASHDATSTATVGEAVHLRAVVDDADGTPTGKVTLKRYANATCTGSGTTIGSPSLTSGAVDKTSLTVSFANAGTYSFMASYQGDGSYFPAASACTTLKVEAVASTPKPSAAPSAAPTIVPGVTPAPASSPAASPDAAASPAPTIDPSASEAPGTASSPAAETGVPAATAEAGAPAPGDGAQPGGVGGPVTPAGDAGAGSLLLLVLLVLLVMAGVVGVAVARRRPEPRGA